MSLFYQIEKMQFLKCLTNSIGTQISAFVYIHSSLYFSKVEQFYRYVAAQPLWYPCMSHLCFP